MIVRKNHRTSGAGRRRGISIIEVMVMMTAVAVMLGMCVIILQLAMKLETDGRGRFERATTLSRLARQFRADVHEARKAEILSPDPKQAPVLRIEAGSGRSVDYQVKREGEVARAETANGNFVSRESFQIPQTGAVRMELREIDGRRFAVLVVDTLTRKNRTDPVRSLEILGLVGKDVRSLASATKAEGGKP